MAGKTLPFQFQDGETVRVGKTILQAASLIAESGLDVEQAASQTGCTVNKLNGWLRSEIGKRVLEEMSDGGEAIARARARGVRNDVMREADHATRLKAAQDVLDRAEGKAIARTVSIQSKTETVRIVVDATTPLPEGQEGKTLGVKEVRPGVYEVDDGGD